MRWTLDTSLEVVAQVWKSALRGRVELPLRPIFLQNKRSDVLSRARRKCSGAQSNLESRSPSFHSPLNAGNGDLGLRGSAALPIHGRAELPLRPFSP